MIGQLSAERRADTGKGAARRLRSEGKVPGIIYMGGREPEMLALNAIELGHVLDRQVHVVNVKMQKDGQDTSRQALIREVQLDPVHVHKILHVDLHEISPNQKVDVTVVLRTMGTPVGLSRGGKFALEMRELDVSCLPKNIPEEIVINVADLDFGDQLLVKDLDLSEGVEAIGDPEQLIAHVVAPRGGLGAEAEAEAAEEAAAGAGDVEVISKGKEEEEE